MNKRNFFILLTVILIAVFIAACGNSPEQNNANSNSKGKATEEKNKNREETSNGNENSSNDNEEELVESNNKDTATANHSEQVENKVDDSSGSEENDPLSNYSAKEIEYARVWLEVVDNKGIDTLKVSHISEGESVGQYEDKSVKYPENVVHLFTDFLAGGNVFYSSNGDGSINLYDVPTRWPTPEQLKEERNQTMKEYTQSIIDNPKKVVIDPGDDEEVQNVIEKIEIID
ncbi:hypothetical protein BN988_02835 [Oceanobacillus picturae]|uniref:Lipoprotein n=1 Tax=Oceanobacillus picturae TaxID=171693 RepID=W9ANR8_9BACI|nr:hypothetical protein [Oceanobacillus picturae]CDO04281.1 hypothetical protein BN988_02835 [Oceanobacillus picturae]